MKTVFLTGSLRMAAGLFLLLSSSAGMAANTGFPGDSLRSNYPLNDPRNPNCPCHRYQQLAEEEYQQLKQAGKSPADTSISLPALVALPEDPAAEDHLDKAALVKPAAPYKNTKVGTRRRRPHKAPKASKTRQHRAKRHGGGKLVACFHW